MIHERTKMVTCDKHSILQINKVPAGGRTVFPRLGVSAKPTPGAAIFWYNLHDTGDPDRRTLHGACPVLYGTKWGKVIGKCYQVVYEYTQKYYKSFASNMINLSHDIIISQLPYFSCKQMDSRRCPNVQTKMSFEEKYRSCLSKHVNPT